MIWFTVKVDQKAVASLLGRKAERATELVLFIFNKKRLQGDLFAAFQ